jgi:hypothetical protein
MPITDADISFQPPNMLSRDPTRRQGVKDKVRRQSLCEGSLILREFNLRMLRSIIAVVSIPAEVTLLNTSLSIITIRLEPETADMYIFGIDLIESENPRVVYCVNTGQINPVGIVYKPIKCQILPKLTI